MNATAPQHVWCTLTADWSNPHPALLLSWRNRPPAGWEAWVIIAEPGPADTSVREMWVPASAVRPVGEAQR